VGITSISGSGASVTANLSVTTKSAIKDLIDSKGGVKDFKETKETKEQFKDILDANKGAIKDLIDSKGGVKDFKETKEQFKDILDIPGGLAGAGGAGQVGAAGGQPDVETRLSMLEAVVFGDQTGQLGGGQAGQMSGQAGTQPRGQVGAGAGGRRPQEGIQPFIHAGLRPELLGAGGSTTPVELEQRMAAGDAGAKREFDTSTH
jgi:hypothetical protein